MIALNHKVLHKVTGFQKKLGELLGVGKVGGSPYSCPTYEEAHAIRTSSLAGSASLFLIPKPSQNVKNSHN